MDGIQDTQFHYEVGKQLAPLRDEGILVIGNGNIIHNLRRMKRGEDALPFDWAIRFNDKVREYLASRNHEALIDYVRLGDDARLSVPTLEHYLPLVYIAALQSEGESMPFDQ
ncbi:MAG TPA: class III extradiol ring-cleavage dioxygenase [Acidiferrobacterales bacterium]|nr:class III extradiol ring-cleavage dioxygenase [Acidiferrobacterales bacterium]